MQITDVIAESESTPPIGKTLEAVGFRAEQALLDLFRGDVSGVVELGSTYLLPSGLALLAVFIGYLMAKYVSRIISHPVCRSVDETLGKFVGRVVFYAILISVVGATLSHVGVKMGGLAAVLGAAGFAVGLAFQGTLSNFAAGVLLLVFRPFKVGDMVNAAGVIGKVNEIDLFTTTLDTPDNRRIIVPNSSISGGTIENVSYHKHRRVEVLVGVEYAADLQQTRDALQRAVNNLAAQTIQGPDRGAMVMLAGLGSSSVDWKVRMWVNTPDFFKMTELLTGQVKTELDAAGVKIPFPQMDVHLHRVDRPQQSNDVDTTIELHRPDLANREALVNGALERAVLRKRPMLRA